MKALTELASKIAEDARSNATENNLPEEVQRAIKVGNAKSQGDGNFSVSVKIDLNEAEMAAAYEFGSGERATRGVARDYPIVPKKANALHFIWNYPSPLGRKIKPFDEEVYLQGVMHPGVEARPYLTPALKDNIKLITFNLSRSFLGTIQEITPKVVIIKKES